MSWTIPHSFTGLKSINYEHVAMLYRNSSSLSRQESQMKWQHTKRKDFHAHPTYMSVTTCFEGNQLPDLSLSTDGLVFIESVDVKTTKFLFPTT